MADETRVEVVGFTELIVGSRRLFDKIGDKATDNFGQVAQQEAGVVSGRMPRKTGRLAGSVTSTAERGAQTASVGVSKSGVPYAGFVEFGGIRNRPYFPNGRNIFPVALAAEPQLVAAGGAAATDEIRGFRWPTPRP